MTMKKTKQGLPLYSLLKGIEHCTIVRGNNAILVTGITCDSRNIHPGYLFVALQGERSCGHEFVEQALAKGAVAVLSDGQEHIIVPDDIVLLHSHNPRETYAHVAAQFFMPQPQVIVAVTGTNGKTSVAQFFAQLCYLLNHPAASVGTIGVQDGKGQFLTDAKGLTTPAPEELYRTLADLKEMQIEHVAIEASSHGLSQYRMHAVQLQAAAFTNLSHDHLDYHKTLDHYLNSKMKLFTEILPKGSVAVINADDQMYAKIEEICQKSGHTVHSVGKKGSYIKIREIVVSSGSQDVSFEIQNRRYQVTLSLTGSFQASNLLCAVALVLACGMKEEEVIAVLPNIRGVSGRMEQVTIPTHTSLPLVIVDYAHTPDGLEKSLSELKKITKGKLWVVFGCGGDRDSTKRPEMGAIAVRLADHVIVTDDNPRYEDPQKIRQEILASAKKAIEIGDRYQAIHYAISHSNVKDSILLAGKGHEKIQIIGNQTIPCDDVVIAKEALAQK